MNKHQCQNCSGRATKRYLRFRDRDKKNTKQTLAKHNQNKTNQPRRNRSFWNRSNSTTSRMRTRMSESLISIRSHLHLDKVSRVQISTFLLSASHFFLILKFIIIARQGSAEWWATLVSFTIGFRIGCRIEFSFLHETLSVPCNGWAIPDGQRKRRSVQNLWEIQLKIF